jgi:hypothetical protein
MIRTLEDGMLTQLADSMLPFTYYLCHGTMTIMTTLSPSSRVAYINCQLIVYTARRRLQ